MNKIVLGLNLGKTQSDKGLKDGAAALFVGKKLVSAIAQERLTRKKHDGGAVAVAKLLLDNQKISCDEVDIVVTSSCCELERPSTLFKEFPNAEVLSCNHHLSHAYSAFFCSSYDNAIVCVFDGGGNLIDIHSNEWWKVPREQHSYYLARGNDVSLIEMDFEDSLQMGFGEVYRAFTKFLGFSRAENAGKVMSLAAYGKLGALNLPPIFHLAADGSLTGMLKYSESRTPKNADLIVADFISDNIGSVVSPRDDGQLLTQFHADVALYIQQQLELALINKISYLKKKYSISNFCITGGVAYNCKANGALERAMKDAAFYFFPTAGDQGQCIGNAISGLLSFYKSIPKVSLNNTYLGDDEPASLKEIIDFFKDEYANNPFVAYSPKHLVCAVAEEIKEFKVGGICRGRSELGPRALGNRSIIARSDSFALKDKINTMKGRDLFMPLAPVVQEDVSAQYFEISKFYPYMTTAVIAKDDENEFLCGVLHYDGTARLQTVDINSNRFLFRLLSEVKSKGAPQVLINTSFNEAGQPIVRTWKEAVRSGVKMGLDFIVLGDFLLKRNQFQGCLSDRFNIIEVFGCQFFSCSIGSVKLPFSKQFFYRTYFALFDTYYGWLLEKRKTTTIRFNKSGLDVPRYSILPLYTNSTYHDSESITYVAQVFISKITVKKFADLDHSDALNDGFSSLGELTTALSNIYGDDIFSGVVTIYSINVLKETLISN